MRYLNCYHDVTHIGRGSLYNRPLSTQLASKMSTTVEQQQQLRLSRVLYNVHVNVAVISALVMSVFGRIHK